MQTESVDISIIVPCRNEEKFIKETIRRIVAQKGDGRSFNFELLIVDEKALITQSSWLKKKQGKIIR